jgi:hypothetical protein
MTTPPDNAGAPPPIDAATIAAMSGTEFEALVAALLRKMGFTVNLTKASHDGGIDIVAECHAPMMRGAYIIQCKRYDGSVGEPFVRDLYGVMTAERANKGILITNSTFTASAVEFASGKPLELIDGGILIQLLARHGIVTAAQATISFATDPEIARLKKLVEVLPNELRWRVQLAQHLLNVVEYPHGISSRAELMPFVVEAEIQLSTIYAACQKRPGNAYAFLEHSCAIWLGRLQLRQCKLAGAVSWMAGLRRGNYYGVDAESEAGAADPVSAVLNGFHTANAVNIANIAATTGKPLIRQRVFSWYAGRINRLREARKDLATRVLKFEDRNPNRVDYCLDVLRRLDRIDDDIDLLFSPTAIARDFSALENAPSAFPHAEVGTFLINLGSIVQTIAPPGGIVLAQGEITLADQGDAVEAAIQPWLEDVEKFERHGAWWRAIDELRAGNEITVRSGPFEHCKGAVTRVFRDRGTFCVVVRKQGQEIPLEFKLDQLKAARWGLFVV